jgi:hypothetical protein
VPVAVPFPRSPASIDQVQGWFGETVGGEGPRVHGGGADDGGASAVAMFDRLSASAEGSAAAQSGSLSPDQVGAAVGLTLEVRDVSEMVAALRAAGDGAHTVVGVRFWDGSEYTFNVLYDGGRDGVYTVDAHRREVQRSPAPFLGFHENPVVSWRLGVPPAPSESVGPFAVPSGGRDRPEARVNGSGSGLSQRDTGIAVTRGERMVRAVDGSIEPITVDGPVQPMSEHDRAESPMPVDSVQPVRRLSADLIMPSDGQGGSAMRAGSQRVQDTGGVGAMGRAGELSSGLTDARGGEPVEVRSSRRRQDPVRGTAAVINHSRLDAAPARLPHTRQRASAPGAIENPHHVTAQDEEYRRFLDQRLIDGDIGPIDGCGISTVRSSGPQAASSEGEFDLEMQRIAVGAAKRSLPQARTTIAEIGGWIRDVNLVEGSALWTPSVDPALAEAREHNCVLTTRVVYDRLSGRHGPQTAGLETRLKADQLGAFTGFHRYQVTQDEIAVIMRSQGAGAHAAIAVRFVQNIAQEGGGHVQIRGAHAFNVFFDGRNEWAIDGQFGTIIEWSEWRDRFVDRFSMDGVELMIFAPEQALQALRPW